ncbi:MAG: ImmA/IrrE family metallo-endopeptidase [Andreesenia angusta]|nr:ImmA/IrrE family metallo-endopeptidase [Andreesenia angusta]
MSFYDKIRNDVFDLIDLHETRDPKKILIERNIILMPFKRNTKLLGMYKIIMRNRFVFYNPNIDEKMLRMVLAHELGHDLYHREIASKNELIEYTLLDINSEMEMEANIFAAHLLLDENEIDELAKREYNYEQMARACNVNLNLLIIKLNEMQRQGYKLNLQEYGDRNFFRDIDGRK